MDCDSPCKSEWELNESTQQLLFNLLFFLIKRVFHVFPYFTLHVMLMPVLIDDGNNAFLLIDIDHDTDCAIHPSLLFVVANEDDLCSRLQFKLDRRRKRGLGKFSFNMAFKDRRLSFKSG